LGGPAIGFKQDFNASHQLQKVAPDAYSRYKADKESSFFGFKTIGLDGAKVGVLDDGGKELNRVGELLAKENKTDANYSQLSQWWQSAKEFAPEDKKPVQEAGIFGGKMALKLTAYVPAAMAVCYLLLILYFKSIGGYKAVHIESPEALGTAET
jgi:hypothetical protein